MPFWKRRVKNPQSDEQRVELKLNANRPHRESVAKQKQMLGCASGIQLEGKAGIEVVYKRRAHNDDGKQGKDPSKARANEVPHRAHRDILSNVEFRHEQAAQAEEQHYPEGA